LKTYSDVVIVGAGPYGLSIAAHLRAAGVSFRIFGSPMQVWRERMPDGMLLKSDGFASNLSDPATAFTLKRFCELAGTPYDDKRIPIHIDTFRAYGLAFQQRLVPELEDAQVTRIERDGGFHRLRLDTGETVTARNVVVAVGISYFSYVPPILGGLPGERLSHSSCHKNVERFRGREVTVIGGGASAVDLAVLLKDIGADVTLLARRPVLKFNDPPPDNGHSFVEALRYPSSPIGPGWTARFYSDAPRLFHSLPQKVRLRIMGQQYSSAAGWPMKERFLGKVPALLGYEVQSADAEGGCVRLVLTGPEGRREHTTNQVIAATGYRVDLRRLAFLSPEIASEIRSIEHTPVLSSTFASSVPGLYFVGVASANSFGPLMRFACGAEWTAKRISAILAAATARTRVAAVVNAGRRAAL
jgi:putative flavoprotein involved in K+ transport